MKTAMNALVDMAMRVAVKAANEYLASAPAESRDRCPGGMPAKPAQDQDSRGADRRQ
jgi:hypothetical protein